ncbi:MAG TPA: hypothetical protein VFQ84_11420 [Arenimonas sp.]|uniref:hypothetical protein n=1 Tax=Arenimonas sp. TaxID=1872635 RepID=UPI002D807294|nr:hypothetical protein [Arenimonas sp.]HEU0153939.1 hypothetical protein [Arenimonas sp.]
MIKPHSHIEIAYSSIRVFNDGQMDLGELNFLLGLALRDQQVDDEEKRVLAKIFAQAEQTNLSPLVKERIAEARRNHGIPA